MNLPKYIKSNDFALIVAMASVLLQSGHTYHAFLSAETLTPNWVDYTFSVLAAIVIDFAILFYTLRNRKDIAVGAMIAMMAINGYHYWIIHEAFTIRFFAGVAFSMIIPISVYFYSEEIKVTRSKK